MLMMMGSMCLTAGLAGGAEIAGLIAAAVERAIETVLDDRANHPPDLGGSSTTEQVVAALEAAL